MNPLTDKSPDSKRRQKSVPMMLGVPVAPELITPPPPPPPIKNRFAAESLASPLLRSTSTLAASPSAQAPKPDAAQEYVSIADGSEKTSAFNRCRHRTSDSRRRINSGEGSASSAAPLGVPVSLALLTFAADNRVEAQTLAVASPRNTDITAADASSALARIDIHRGASRRCASVFCPRRHPVRALRWLATLFSRGLQHENDSYLGFDFARRRPLCR